MLKLILPCLLAILAYWLGFVTFLKLLGLISGLVIIYKPARFYVLSFGFEWLFEHPNVAKLCGIHIASDLEFKTSRQESEVYMSGIIVYLFTCFTGMDVIIKPHTFSEFKKLQNKHNNDIDVAQYNSEIKGKRMSLTEFEMWLSDMLLRETNRCFNIVDQEVETELIKNNRLIRKMIANIIGQEKITFWEAVQNLKKLVQISKLLRSVPEYKRLFLFVPQLTLIDVTTKRLVELKDKFQDETVGGVLTPNSKFFVMVQNGNLIFIKRHKDDSDSATNRAFGPIGLQCPANIYSRSFLKAMINAINDFDVVVEGEPTYTTGRFQHINNKDDIFLTFNPKTDSETFSRAPDTEKMIQIVDETVLQRVSKVDEV